MSACWTKGTSLTLSQACQFYVASFWLLPVTFDVLMPQASLNPAQMQTVLKHVSHLTGAEVVFKSNCFEMHGSESQVRAAVMRVLELEVVQVSGAFLLVTYSEANTDPGLPP